MNTLSLGVVLVVLGATSLTGLAQTADGAGPKAAPVRIAVIGDSTVADYDTAKLELRGWGQLLPAYLDGRQAQVTNFALSGRSSKSFLNEGRWAKVRAMQPAPTHVLIQFGHNDVVGKGPQRETLPGPVPATLPSEGTGSQPSDYFRNNLRTYIEETRAMGATPVLVTPMERRLFAKDKIRLMNQPYATAMKEVGAEMQVAVIDLNAFSVEQYNQLGVEPSASLHVVGKDGKTDNSHYNEQGARLWAKFIAQQLREKVESLRDVVKTAQEGAK